MLRSAAVGSVLALVLAGCFIPPSATQRLADAANEMNSASHFGRMDIAIEHVGPSARQAFARSHAGWGRSVRVVDLEMAGFEMVKKDEAEVRVNVTWLRPDDPDVRVSQIVQRWRDEKGHWQIVQEDAKEGDPGLLGEDKPAPAPADAVAPGAEATPGPRQRMERVVIREE
ncbi:hypothetical protein [Chondromyces apiculatus]|nr:hypothetical protein [Chondromyces apiculatus]